MTGKVKNKRLAAISDIWRGFIGSPTGTLIINLLLSYLLFLILRVIFLLENGSILLHEITLNSLGSLTAGSLLFDTSAICYLDSLYIVMMLLPLRRKVTSAWWKVARWTYIVPNSMAVIATFCDACFFPFNNRRVSSMVFDEFSGEDNIGRIIGVELVNHWYLVLVAILIIYALVKITRSPRNAGISNRIIYFATGIPVLALGVMLMLTGMRGGSFFKATRPISINEAHRFVDRPAQTAIVLNTPFSILRTINQGTVKVPDYIPAGELDTIFSPLHQPADTAHFTPRNVVVLIVESFAQEFIGSRNSDLDGGAYKGYTTFADSLLSVSLTWDQTFANAGFSIDAMPAILASIPRMDRPFVLSPFAVRPINSIASVLGGKGYHTAFFHGANNQSLGFNAFSRQAGFDKYFGLDEYCEDPSTGGMKDFDGTWGIWDEEFLQYFCHKISEMPQPFVATVFTLSSHHPFAIPERYRSTFPDEGKYPLHKCIRYTDNALRLFFDEARKQSWYDNTIFILSADHASSKVTHDEYQTSLGHFRIPILFFDPSGKMPRGTREGIAQQSDIMPTLLDFLGYDKPYISFGKSMLSTPAAETWAFNWDNVKQYIYRDYIMQLQGDKVTAIYNYRTDPLMRHNLGGTLGDIEEKMRRHALAVEQSFISRASSATLVP